MRICSKVERYKQLLFFKGLGGYNKFVAESLRAIRESRALPQLIFFVKKWGKAADQKQLVHLKHFNYILIGLAARENPHRFPRSRSAYRMRFTASWYAAFLSRHCVSLQRA